MTPEAVLQKPITQPQRRPVSVSSTLDNLIDSIGDYFASVAQANGPVITLLDLAAQPWLGLGALVPPPDAGSATAAGSAAAFFVKGGQQAVSALVEGAGVATGDYFIPDWNYGIVAGDFNADFNADFSVYRGG